MRQRQTETSNSHQYYKLKEISPRLRAELFGDGTLNNQRVDKP